MTKNELLELAREKGENDAIELRTQAVAGVITDTEIIDREDAVPDWSEGKDYTNFEIGTPVKDDGQVYALIIPHNPAHYPGVRPINNRTLWSLKHTKNPLKAKLYVEPSGTSGMYMKDECCIDPNTGSTTQEYISKYDNNVYSPSQYPENWTAWEK